MNELQRWKDAVAAEVASGKLKSGSIPGYTPPNPLAVIWVDDSRIGAGPGRSPIKSFQATLQSRVASLANNNFFRTNADASLVSDLLGGLQPALLVLGHSGIA